jgi:hypothetical protein
MKNLIHKILLQEALKPSQFRKYVKDFNRERYTDIFKKLGDEFEHDKNYYRIYIPLGKEEKSGPVSNVEKEVTDFLTQNGYQVLDYIKGIVKFGDAKNTTSIGKVLTRLKADDLMKKFVSDEARKALTSDIDNLMVVISRHPYDIAGSDTDRNWTNCMTIGHASSNRVETLHNQLNTLNNKLSSLQKEDPNYVNILKKIKNLKSELEDRKEEGENVKYLIHEVKEGSLISYLINKNDKNINNPLAVLNIKPYINEKNPDDFVLVSSKNMYGNGRPEFKSTVNSILEKINGNVTGFYCINPKTYKDLDSERIYVPTKEEKEATYKFLYDLMSNLKTVPSKNKPGWMLYKDESGITVMADNVDIDKKNPYLLIRGKIWWKLNEEFKLNYREIDDLLVRMLEIVHKRKVFTTATAAPYNDTLLEIVHKRKVFTTELI